jgi:hypothetical protein
MPNSTPRRCAGTTKQGQPCKAPVRPETGKCIAHSPKEFQDSVGFGGSQKGSGRPKNPRAVDVLRERIEADVDQVLAPLFDALSADRGLALVLKGGGMEIGYTTDHETRIKAARELLDRAYGRPKQQTELTGAYGGPLEVATAISPPGARRRQVATMLEKAGALEEPS